MGMGHKLELRGTLNFEVRNSTTVLDIAVDDVLGNRVSCRINFVAKCKCLRLSKTLFLQIMTFRQDVNI